MFLIKISNIQSLKLKPWIAPGYIKINFTKELYKSFPKEKDPHKKANYERQFKTQRNLIFLNLHFKHISNNFKNFFVSIAEIINRNIVKAKKLIFHMLTLN